MIFDAHLRIIDSRFPLVENRGYLPDPFTVLYDNAAAWYRLTP